MTDPETTGARARRVTRQDVARAAGVSVTTVTHALNPKPGVRVSAATRERVSRIARELGYRPSFVGRALVSGRTYTVGLLQPATSALAYSFYQLITMGLSEAMQDAEYHPLILFRSADRRYLRVIRQGRVDGMLVLQSDMDPSVIREVAGSGIPTVAVNVRYRRSEEERAGCVHSDHAGMMRDVIEEFVSCGCRSLLSVHDYRSHDANAVMHDVFVDESARRSGDGVVGSSLIPVPETFEAQCRNLFRCGPRWEGIFVDGVRNADRMVAAGLECGVEAGRDFQLIVAETHPDQRTASGLERALYSHQPRRLGQEAWAVLYGLIEGRRVPQETQIPYRRVGVNEVVSSNRNTEAKES